MKRRTRLGLGLGTLGALLALGAIATCVACSGHNQLYVATATPSGPPMPKGTRVLYFADFGDDTFQRRSVIDAMAREHADRPFDFAVELGDNIYPCGPDETLPGAAACAFEADGNTVDAGYAPPADPAFGEHFDRPMARISGRRAPLQTYVVLGNHDVGGALGCLPIEKHAIARVMRAKACLEVAHNAPGWTMPGRHYVVDRGAARFIVFDSNFFYGGDYGGFSFEEEIAFVREAAAGCAGKRCFLASHQGPYTSGLHMGEAANAEVLARVKRIEEAAGGITWLAAHDHDLQHLRAPNGYDVFVSGNTARGRPEKFDGTTSNAGAKLLFGSTYWAFAALEVGPDGYGMTFIDEKGASIYCCAAVGGGRCEPTACPAR